MKYFLGVELGSTRIKAVTVNERGGVVKSGSHAWHDTLVDGRWTYDLQDAVNGVRESIAACGDLPELCGMGVSAMMHGYLALDKSGNLLAPFRTWRNTDTGEAAALLTKAFGYNIPLRWSIAHLYQAILRDEPHVKDIAHVTTLSGYVHWLLTGERVLGIGDASGMFPVNGDDYDGKMLAAFDALVAHKKYPWKLRDILPRVVKAGEQAGRLTKTGAALTGLRDGLALCPPEGDAGTGMVATNSVRAGTGNVSAGTSVFAMAVLDKPLARLHTEIDNVTTPDGAPVAMVHANHCTNEINAWARVFGEVVALFGKAPEEGELFTKLFGKSAESDADVGSLTGYNFLAGEPVAGIEAGMPLLLRDSGGKLNLANFMQMQIYGAVAALNLGMEILKGEGVRIRNMCGHGGFFKTEGIGQTAMSAAVDAPVTVRKNAGEGGAWGIALLALYMRHTDVSLADFLEDIFRGAEETTVSASEDEKKKFASFMARYKAHLAVVRAAAEIR